MVSLGLSALLRGGEIAVATDQRRIIPHFCPLPGSGVRRRRISSNFIGQNVPPIDALTVQTYFACRLAESAGRLEVLRDGADIILSARS